MSFRTGAFGGSEWLLELDDLLLGLVDLLDAVRRHVHRPHLARAARSASSSLGVLLVPSRRQLRLVRDLRRRGDRPAAQRQADLVGRGAKPGGVAVRDARAVPARRPSPRSLVMFLVALFFVSGADAASVVMGMLSSRGSLSRRRWRRRRVGRADRPGGRVLLLAGGLTALQQAAIIAAAPFVFIMVGMVVGLLKRAAARAGQRHDGPGTAGPRVRRHVTGRHEARVLLTPARAAWAVPPNPGTAHAARGLRTIVDVRTGGASRRRRAERGGVS